jgi:hypothetical protein
MFRGGDLEITNLFVVRFSSKTKFL